MKKLLTIGTSIATFFTLTIPAFALDNKSLNPCDNNTNDALKAACAGQGLSLESVLFFHFRYCEELMIQLSYRHPIFDSS